MSKSLGRGLSSLIPNAQQQTSASSDDTRIDGAGVDIPWIKGTTEEILRVSPHDVIANPYQPRRVFDTEALEDLMRSIQEHGILQPLVVTRTDDGPFELIAGERRLRAAQELKLKTVPVIVRSVGELEKLELSLVENIQRQDLNPIERATAYRRLIDEFSLTHEQTATRLSKSRPVISNHLRLLDLPREVQTFISHGRLTESLALAVLEVEGDDKRIAFARQIVEQNLTKREAASIVRQSGSPRKNKQHTTRDPVVRVLEERMQSALSTRVKIGRRGKKGWVIEIETYSQEELESIVDTIAQ